MTKEYKDRNWQIGKPPLDSDVRWWLGNRQPPSKTLPPKKHAVKDFGFDYYDEGSLKQIPDNATHFSVVCSAGGNGAVSFYTLSESQENPNYEKEVEEYKIALEEASREANDIYIEWEEWKLQRQNEIEQAKEDEERKQLIKLLQKYGAPE